MADNASPALANIRRKIRAAVSAGAGPARQADPLALPSKAFAGKHRHPAGRTVCGAGKGGVSRRGAGPGSRYLRQRRHGVRRAHERSGGPTTRSGSCALTSRRRSPAFCWSFPERLAPFADSIIESYNYAVQLDLIFAKAQVAYRMKAVVPQVGEDGRIVLHAARHPLIPKDKVVPTDITLGVVSFDHADYHGSQYRRQDSGSENHRSADADGHVRPDDPRRGGQPDLRCSGTFWQT